MRNRLRSGAAGAFAGAVATLAMSAVLLAGRRAGLFGALGQLVYGATLSGLLERWER